MSIETIDKVVEQEVDKQYLQYDRPSPDGNKIDTIVVMGTSKQATPISFEKRIITTLEYAQQSPKSIVIFSGKQAHGIKALSEESGDTYIEAKVMADEAVRRGLDAERIRLEMRATNAKENVTNSLAMLSSGEEAVLFVSSGYLGRRIDLYLQKMRQTNILPHKKEYFIVDADVREDSLGIILADEQIRHKQESILYESARIERYRAKGDL